MAPSRPPGPAPSPEGRPTAVGVIPCAGASSRMGTSKALLDAGGAPFLARAVTALRDGGCDPVVVVLPKEGAAEEERVASVAGARVLRNPDPGDGPISSIRVALRALRADRAGVGASGAPTRSPVLAVLPVDHPGVRPETVRALLDAAACREDAQIVLPRFGDRRGHPALFRGPALEELRSGHLPQGARSVVRRDPDRVLEVPVDDPAVTQDIDRPENYARWYGRGAGGGPLDPAEPGGSSGSVDAARAAEFVLEGLEDRLVTVVVTRLEAPAPERMAWSFRDGQPLRKLGAFSRQALDAAAPALARAVALGQVPPGRSELAGEAVYLERHTPASELVIVGAGHIARPLCTAASLAGFRVVVADDRPDFATRERFPEAHRLVPFDFRDPFRGVAVDEHTHVVLVTRGHKFDYECLRMLLKRDRLPGYVGMIGSRRRVRATWEKLLGEGIPRERVATVRAPVGLDLGAHTPGEIALAVAAELVLVRRGGTGEPLHARERVLERFFPEGDMEVEP